MSRRSVVRSGDPLVHQANCTTLRQQSVEPPTANYEALAGRPLPQTQPRVRLQFHGWNHESRHGSSGRPAWIYQSWLRLYPATDGEQVVELGVSHSGAVLDVMRVMRAARIERPSTQPCSAA